MDTKKLKVAVYFFLMKDNKYMLIKRGDTNYMNGYYSIPAGKVDEGEGIIEGGIREMNEELSLNLDSKDISFEHVLFRDEWVDVFLSAKIDEYKVVEPNKITEILWVENLENLPEPFIPCVADVIQSIGNKLKFSENHL
jgi:8-oxo-dGTP diphosphatase